MNAISSVVIMRPALQKTALSTISAAHSLNVFMHCRRPLGRLLRTCRLSYHNFRAFSISRTFTTSAKHLEELFEEERLPGYLPEQFYPINLGETQITIYCGGQAGIRSQFYCLALSRYKVRLCRSQTDLCR